MGIKAKSLIYVVALGAWLVGGAAVAVSHGGAGHPGSCAAAAADTRSCVVLADGGTGNG